MFYHKGIYACETRLVDLPCSIRAYTIYDAVDDFYNIYINQNLSTSAMHTALLHELKHIENGDFHSRNSSVDDIENQYLDAI